MAHQLLLADDSATIQRVIELIFAEEDVSVTAVGNGRQAIDRIRAEPPDIVLVDIEMPEKDGYEVAALMKSDPTLSHIPVVLLAGPYEPIDEARARSIGCDAVLVKPFEPKVVVNRVRELLAGERPGVPRAVPKLSSDAAAENARTAGLRDSFGGQGASPEDSLDGYFARLQQSTSTFGQAMSPSTIETGASDSSLSQTDGRTSKSAAEATAVNTSDKPPLVTTVAASKTELPRTELLEPVLLAEIFAALLAAEQSWPLPPATPAEQAISALATERLVAVVTRRVLDQLTTDKVVQDVVAREVSRVAERLIQGEVGRIKADAT